MRKALAVAVSVAIQLSALSAPLLHVHPDSQTTDHHRGRTVHSHWVEHHPAESVPGTPAIEEADHDRAVFLNVFVARAGSWLPAPGLSLDVFALPAPAERRSSRAIDVVRSHDPPGGRTAPSRAPPTFLS